jgi:hypothetical protein
MTRITSEPLEAGRRNIETFAAKEEKFPQIYFE